jgi:hypothetical protein
VFEGRNVACQAGMRRETNGTRKRNIEKHIPDKSGPLCYVIACRFRDTGTLIVRHITLHSVAIPGQSATVSEKIPQKVEGYAANE